MSKVSTLTGMMICLLGFLSFSLQDVIGKYLAMQGHSTIFLAFCLTSIMLMVLVVAAPLLGGWRNTWRTREKKLHAIRAITILPSLPINVYAFTQMPMSMVYAILMCTPMLTTLLARFWLGERQDRKVYGLILVGFVGVIISMHPGSTPVSWAMIGVMCTAMLGAIRGNLLRKAGAEETALSLLLFPCLAMNIAYIIPALNVASSFTLPHAGLLLLEGIFYTFGFIGMAIGYRMAPAAFAAMTHYSQIVWGIVFGWLVFHNEPDTLTLIGSSIIIASGLGMVWMARPKRVVKDMDVELD